MIGDPWNTLVAAPTKRELDAAMAEVRVRAMGHARRREWRSRAWSALGYVVVAGVALVGGRSLGTGLRLYGSLDEVPVDAGGWPSARAVAGSATVARGDLQRYHITLRTELDGVPIGEGEVWVEGPNGTAFRLHVSQLDRSFAAQVVPLVQGDSMKLLVNGDVTNELGFTRNHGRVTEQVPVGLLLSYSRGAVAEVLPFGRRRGSGIPYTVIRVEGPDASPPRGAVRWRGAGDSVAFLSYLTGEQGLTNSSVEAARRGVRAAMANVGALTVVPQWFVPPLRLRLSLRGGATSPWVWASQFDRAAQVRVSGEAGALEVRGIPRAGRPGEACIQLREPAPPGVRPFALGCFASDVPDAPIEIELHGRTFIVERSP
jgi:hypothetical protein